MRRFLFFACVLAASSAHAQTHSARPVELFSYGSRAGTPVSPLWAALSSVVPPANAETQAASPVELFSYGRRVGTETNPLSINLTGPLVSSGNVSVGQGSSLIMQSTQGVHLALTYAFGAIVGTSSDGSPVQLILDQYRETLRTPASATASCQPGQWADDASWHYLCAAANTWVTVPYSTFQATPWVPITGGSINGQLSVTVSPGALAISTVGTSQFASGTYSDPDVGVLRDVKFGANGIAVKGGTKTDTLNVSTLTGTGNGFACLNSSGQVYRSSTACN